MVRPNYSMRAGVVSALKCGTEFHSTQELLELGETLERVHMEDVYNRYGVPIPNNRSVVGDQSELVYSIRSDAYVPANHGDVVRAVVKGLDAVGCPAQGWVHDSDGRLNVFMVFAEPMKMGEDTQHLIVTPKVGDDYALGFHVFNSYCGDLSYGLQTMMYRFLCENGAIIADIMGKLAVKHTGQIPQIIEGTPEVVGRLLENRGFLQDILENAAKTLIMPEMFEDVLWGVGLPVGGVNAIMENPVEFCPEIEGEGLTVLNGFNAATAYITYRDNGESAHTTATLFKDVQTFLSSDWHALAKKGADRKQKYKDAQAKAKLERDTGKKVIDISFKPRKLT